MMSTFTAPSPPPSAPAWGAGRVLAVVSGAMLVLVGVALLAAGGLLAWADGSGRDRDGYLNSPAKRFSTAGYAITAEELDLSGLHDRVGGRELQDVAGRIRIRATNAGGVPVFVGIARQGDADRFLAGIPRSEVTDVDPVRYRTTGGEGRPGRPADASLWVASASGSGRAQVTWEPQDGTWAVVVMNADGSAGVTAGLRVGAELDWLIWAALALIAGGVLVTGAGGALIAVAAHPRSATAPSPLPYEEGTYPVAVDARDDEPLSRWLWLVKWLLAIPHLLVLAFLWIAFCVLSAFALVAIAFTGRYPRALFDFNVGVMRWSWRVNYYAFALGTDRYPPFSLTRADHPAELDVPYPERLSRGKALVKFWLLAIPHYLVLAALLGTWTAADRGVAPAGLVEALVLIAGFALLFTGRYPADILRLVVGIHRWAFRVLAYAAGMRDEYPPFRFER
jgi:hypothetical protein